SIHTQTQVETKTEITRMQADSERQIKAMQLEIRSRLDQQFQNPIIENLVKDAAKEQTQMSANPLIKIEVARQVKNRVDAEQSNIRHAVTEETQTAVKGMNPQIDKLVKNAVDSTVQNQVDPVIRQIGGLKRDVEIQRMINKLN